MKFSERFRSFFKSSEPKGEIARDNLFLGIARGLHDSVGRLPGPMMVILVVALSVSVLTGVVMQVMSTQNKDSYLPLRLTVNPDKPALHAENLRGVWVYTDPVQTMTIRFGVDVFELIQVKKDYTLTRFFVRGGFRTEGNILILEQRKDLGAPQDRRRLELKFIPLVMDVINVEVEQSQSLMLWRMPKVERARLPDALQVEFPLMDERPMVFTQISKQ
jgi:hypothetical protein